MHFWGFLGTIIHEKMPKIPKMAKNGEKGEKRPFLGIFGHFWPFLGHFLKFCPKMGPKLEKFEKSILAEKNVGKRFFQNFSKYRFSSF